METTRPRRLDINPGGSALIVLCRLYVVIISTLYLTSHVADWPSRLLFMCLIPLPSLVIAVGVGEGKRWAAVLAIAQDVLMVAYVLGFQIYMSSQAVTSVRFSTLTTLPDMLCGFLVYYILSGVILYSVILPLAMVEAVYLIRALKFAVRGVIAVVVAACVAAGMGVAGGARMAQSLQSVYRPLIAYANAHWLTLPDDLRPVDISGSWPTGGGPYVEFDLKLSSPSDSRFDTVFLSAVRSDDGGYRFCGTSRSDVRQSAVSISYLTDRVAKISEARTRLAGMLGPGDSIRLKGSAKVDNWQVWTFYSPTRKATYQVAEISLRVIPDPE